MKLVKCTPHPPRGSVYIGRAMPGRSRGNRYIEPIAASPLKNPFRVKGKKHGVGIPVPRVMERYRRHLTWKLALGYEAPREAMRSLRADSKLACWCATRDARKLEGEVEDAEGACHGDAVFTVWLGLERLGWVWAVGDPQQDLMAFNAAHAGLYETCFGQSLEWGVR